MKNTKMTKSRIIEITRIAEMAAFTAVMADLFYIIRRMQTPAVTLDDASFMYAVPDMLCHMLLALTVITAFLAVMIHIIKNESDDL